MNHTYFLNGKAVDGKVALDSLNSSEAGIFETLRVYNGKIFREEEHLERLRESAKTVGIKNSSLNLKEIRRQIRLAVKAYGESEAALRVTWSASTGPLVMIGQRSLAGKFYKTGVALKTSCVKRSLSNASPPEAKTTDYMNAMLATLEPKFEEMFPSSQEWVFLDQQGYVTEVRTGNLFIVDFCGKTRRLRTPPLRGILNGVTRRFVIECALLQGLEVREEPLTRHEIYNASEAFLTNTSWEILPVRSLDERLIGRAIPGPITKRLHELFRKRVLKECPRSK